MFPKATGADRSLVSASGVLMNHVTKRFEQVRCPSVSVWQATLPWPWVHPPALHCLASLVERSSKVFLLKMLSVNQEVIDRDEEREFVGPRAWRLPVHVRTKERK